MVPCFIAPVRTCARPIEGASSWRGPTRWTAQRARVSVQIVEGLQSDAVGGKDLQGTGRRTRQGKIKAAAPRFA
ncbi:MAG: hypothetical protein B7X53_00060 [Hyphomonas sp. 34-62-18]|nr:MAG: hypothetical protein B7X53_00060 [Hyphomonas sp. 34-62-18]